MRTTRRNLLLPTVCAIAALLTIAGCGGSEAADTKTATTADQPLRAAALSLQQAMDASARAIDSVRGTRDSLDRLAASVQPAIAQTGDVIVLLTPKAVGDGNETKLLDAAREQRSFLQFAVDSTRARSRRAANSALERSREAGRRATTAYTAITRESNELGGLLPASTTFNIGRLRDAVRNVNRGAGSARPPAPPPGAAPPPAAAAPPAAAPSTCGDGVSVNSSTSCPFGRNVAEAYRGSGGASSIEVFSPVTKQTYTMSCSGGIPTVCRGGNNAVVTIR